MLLTKVLVNGVVPRFQPVVQRTVCGAGITLTVKLMCITADGHSK
jgi:hypothetical protein